MKGGGYTKTFANEEEVSVFEDARSEIDEIKVAGPGPPASGDGGGGGPDGLDGLDLGDLELPPLESFLGTAWGIPGLGDSALVGCGSLATSLELDNDVLPSTPLTEEQLLQQTQNANDEQVGGIPINRLNESSGCSPSVGKSGGASCVGPDGAPVSGGDAGAVEDEDGYYITQMMMNAAEQAEEFAISIWHKFQSWKVIHFSHLPQWLQDNDFLHFGHRPPLPTSECFKSIIRIHTETGNIWTHLLGVVAFAGLMAFFMSRPSSEIQLQEKLVFACFFTGAIFCMGLSFLYHTLCCNQDKKIGRLFAKFDYCGISFLTVGSFVPWLYYSFYCDIKPQMIYLSIVILLGIGAVVVSTFDFFAGPRFRPLRAAVFITFGLSGIAPATHFGIKNGWERSVEEGALGWLILMGVLYITGAVLYAVRIPERFFPGKLDIWFHSHQIFHCFVIAGAFVHYHGISIMAFKRLEKGDCPMEPVELQCLIDKAYNTVSTAQE